MVYNFLSALLDTTPDTPVLIDTTLGAGVAKYLACANLNKPLDDIFFSSRTTNSVVLRSTNLRMSQRPDINLEQLGYPIEEFPKTQTPFAANWQQINNQYRKEVN